MADPQSTYHAAGWLKSIKIEECLDWRGELAAETSQLEIVAKATVLNHVPVVAIKNR